MNRPTWTEIRLDNLAENLQSVKKFINENVKYLAVVKADAYGHGAIRCAKKLESAGVDWFGVALPEEAVELRQNGIEKPILSLGSFWEGQEELILQARITPTIFRLELAEKLNRAAKERGEIVEIHVKTDTGMNRVGVRFDEVRDFAEGLKQFENLRVDGLMTHFAAADSDTDFTNFQIGRFEEIKQIFHEKGFRPTYFDLANSPGALGHKNARGNMVRLGGVIYGLTWDVLPKNLDAPELKPVMSLRSKIGYLKTVPQGETVGYSRTFTTQRKTVIASIPIGYHDGYLRGLANKSKVIINGKFANVVGRVSMDWITVDVSEIENANVGDDVILIGESCDLKITAEELAQLAGTISYEITCGIHQRVTKIYKD